MTNEFDWDYLPEFVGSLVLIILFGLIYAGVLAGLTYLVCAGLAYIFETTLPDGLLSFTLIMSVLQTAWKFYKEAKS